mgnify:CR=1 FL=1
MLLQGSIFLLYSILNIPIFLRLHCARRRVPLGLMLLLRHAAANLLLFLRVGQGAMRHHVAEHVYLRLRRGLLGVAPVDWRAGSGTMIGHDMSLPFRSNLD